MPSGRAPVFPSAEETESGEGGAERSREGEGGCLNGKENSKGEKRIEEKPPFKRNGAKELSRGGGASSSTQAGRSGRSLRRPKIPILLGAICWCEAMFCASKGQIVPEPLDWSSDGSVVGICSVHISRQCESVRISVRTGLFSPSSSSIPVPDNPGVNVLEKARLAAEAPLLKKETPGYPTLA